MAVVSALGRLWCWLRGRRYGDFMWCASGVHFWPLDPRAEDVTIEDVARGLANECRYAGQLSRFYSVAEHSVLVSHAVEAMAAARGWSHYVAREFALHGLLHDASEAYVGDIIRPLKYQRDMRAFRKAERRISRVIDRAFHLMPTPSSRALVAEADNRILVDEIGALIRGADMAEQRRKYGEPLGLPIVGLPPDQAEHAFLTRFLELTGLDVGINRRGSGVVTA